MSENIVQTIPIDPISERGDYSTPSGTLPISPMVPPPKKFPFLLTIALLLLSGLAAISIYLLIQVRQLAIEKTTPLPTPTPTASADSTTAWQTYTNNKYSYSFRYPATWTDNASEYTRIESSTFQIRTDKGEYITGTIYDGFDKNFLEDASSKQLKINDKSLQIRYVTDIGEGGQPGIKDLIIFDQILSTFKLTVTSSYKCPESGYVDCMPGPDKDNSACSEDAMKWYKANCPGFQGGAL